MYRTRPATLFVVTALFAAVAIIPLMAFKHIVYSSSSGGMHNKVSISAPPGAPYMKVSELVQLKAHLPGVGTLYADPKTLPVGPYLGYNHSGKLVNVIYMVSVDELETH